MSVHYTVKSPVGLNFSKSKFVKKKKSTGKILNTKKS